MKVLKINTKTHEKEIVDEPDISFPEPPQIEKGIDIGKLKQVLIDKGIISKSDDVE